MDFAENYSFLVQDASQAFHWNNSQATLHPIVVYYRSSSCQLQNLSYVYFSDVLKHDHIAVYTMLTNLIPKLKDILPH